MQRKQRSAARKILKACFANSQNRCKEDNRDVQQLREQYTSGVRWPLELIVQRALVELQKKLRKNLCVMILRYLLSAKDTLASFYDVNLLLDHENDGCIEELVARIRKSAPLREKENCNITKTRKLEETSRATTLHYGSMAQGKASANENKEVRVQALSNIK